MWNKKMTTSQASRIFGIPYNSLLMYVRGKYGKSLKLEQLRKDCISGPPIEMLQMGISGGGGGSSKSDKKERKEKDKDKNGSGGNSSSGGNNGSSGNPNGSGPLNCHIQAIWDPWVPSIWSWDCRWVRLLVLVVAARSRIFLADPMRSSIPSIRKASIRTLQAAFRVCRSAC